MIEAFAYRPLMIITIIIFYHTHSYIPPANMPEVLHRHGKTQYKLSITKENPMEYLKRHI